MLQLMMHLPDTVKRRTPSCCLEAWRQATSNFNPAPRGHFPEVRPASRGDLLAAGNYGNVLQQLPGRWAEKGFAVRAEEPGCFGDCAVMQATPPGGPCAALVFVQLMPHPKVRWNLCVFEAQPSFFIVVLLR